MVEAPETADGIFKRLFLCSLPNIDTMSEEYVRTHGTAISGYAPVDALMRNEIVDRYLSIAQMAEFHERGVNMRVRKYEDTKTIYELIEDHLYAWRNYLQDNPFRRDAPLEDLLLLDKFANAVYDKARYVFNHNSFNTSAIDAFRGGMTMNLSDLLTGGGLFGDAAPVDIDENKDDQGFEKRESFEGIFKSRLNYTPFTQR